MIIKSFLSEIALGELISEIGIKYAKFGIIESDF